MVDISVNASVRKVASRLIVTRIDGAQAEKVVGVRAPVGVSGRKPVLTLDLSPESNWYGQLVVPVPIGAPSVSLQVAEYAGKTVEFVVRPPVRE